MDSAVTGALGTGLSTTVFLVGFASVRLRGQRDRALAKNDAIVDRLLTSAATGAVVSDAEVRRSAEAFKEARETDPVGRWTVILSWSIACVLFTLCIIAAEKSHDRLEIDPSQWPSAGYAVLFFLLAEFAVVITGTADYAWTKGDVERRLDASPMGTVSRALNARQQGDNARAEDLASQIIAELPSWPWAWAFRAQLRVALERYSDAQSDLDRAIALEPGNPWFRIARAEGRLRSEDFEGALADLEHIGDLLPSEPTVIRLHATALYAVGRRPEAIEAFSRAVALAPRDPDLRLDRGQALTDAEPRHSVTAEPANALALMVLDDGERIAVEALSNVGRSRLSDHDLDAAIEDFGFVLTQDPVNVKALTLRGIAYFRKGDKDAGLADFQHALAVGGSPGYILANRGTAYLYAEDPHAAELDFSASIAEEPRARTYFLRAMCREQLRCYDMAIADYGVSLEMDPDLQEARSHRGNALAKIGKLDEAFVDFELAQRADPRDVHNYELWVSSMIRSKRISDALEILDRALIAVPNSGRLILLHGRVNTALKRYANAAADFDLAEQKGVPVDEVAFYRAGMLSDADDLQGALSAVGIASNTRSPSQNLALSLQGTIYRRLGEIGPAMDSFSAALALTPNNASLLVRRGCLRMQCGMTGEALDDFNRAIEREADDVSALVHRAQALCELGRDDEALKDLRSLKPLLSGADAPDMRSELVHIYFALRMWQDTATIIRELLGGTPDDHQLLWLLGATYSNSGAFQDAEAIFRQILRIRPGDKDAWCGLGVSLSQQGRSSEAIATFREIRDALGNEATEWMHRLLPDLLPNFDQVMDDWGRSSPTI